VHLILRTVTRLRGRLASDDGFTLVAVMGVMTVVSILSVAAFTATRGDFRGGVVDKERKQAYAAAEAGVADYLARLVANPDYWRKCADSANPSLNQANPSSRRWANVPNSTSQFSVEVLPANGKSSCATSDPVGTFIDTDTGTFRIRATGRVSTGGPRRSIIATFRRRGFLDYIYYTDYETQDPTWYRREAAGRITRENPRGGGLPQRDVVTWGQEDCTVYAAQGRADKRFRGDSYLRAGALRNGGNANDTRDWSTYTETCGEIQFAGSGGDQDEVNGPLHTNDALLVCGNPKFGRRPTDDIEISNPRPGSPKGWTQAAGCGGEPVVNDDGENSSGRGTLRPNSPLVTLPPSNVALRDEALPAYRFRGTTTIVLEGTSMRVTGKRENGATLNNVSMPVPKDGVIYVGNDTVGSCSGYDPLDPYGASTSCGDAWIRGNYERSITITAENDIVVNENLTAAGSDKPLLGLISNNWIRVYHPTQTGRYGTCENASGGPGSITIDAAILSLRHSFTVDNYWCGAKLGTLTVNGAIAQMYRGPVGTGGSSSGGTGYIKDYNYNDELRFRSPPKFLNPVQTTWKLKSQVEQVPAE
jgi:Tfp pilus assembly protein PilX